MNVRCQCGTITFPTPSPQPLALYHCHCTECRHQSGSAYGTSAIFPSEGLIPLPETLASKLGVWTRPTDAEGMMECYFCRECGTRVLHRSRDKTGSERGVVSIKGGCVEGLDWRGGVHVFVRSAVVPVPEGVERFEGAPPG